ncbi:MAG TPA: hypothetical protein VNB30_00185 [Rhizomicrobium sp.]|nr:hypothetical protein [Rhizomicrobium sp.]
MRSIAATVLFALVVLSAPAWSQGAPDYSKRAAPLEAALKSALVGKWTNPVDHLIVDITDIDLMSGKISGNISPTTGPAAGDAHELIGWVSNAPERKDFDRVIPVTFSTTLYEYGTLPSWYGYLKGGQMITMSSLVWPNKPYAWDHTTLFQVTWTKLPG